MTQFFLYLFYVDSHVGLPDVELSNRSHFTFRLNMTLSRCEIIPGQGYPKFSPKVLCNIALDYSRKIVNNL